MSTTLTLSIDLVTQDGNEAETAFSDKIVVTHLATQTVDPQEGGALREASPGLRILLSGGGEISLAVDGQSFQLSPGSALVVDGGTPVAAQPSDGKHAEDHPPVWHIIELNARFGDAQPLRELLELPLLLEAEHANMVGRHFEQLAFGDALVALPSGNMDISRHLAAIDLVAALVRVAGKSSVVRNMRPLGRRLARLRQFLFENMDHSVTTSDMARHLGMSRASFFRWAKQALGSPPLKYLKGLRLERTQEWIAQDAGTLEQIAGQTGFSDASHLVREFKKRFGMTPAEYRKRARSGPDTEFQARAAERYFSQGRFDEALAACERCLRSAAPDALRDRVRYRKGLCLRALGRGREAVDEWKALRVSGFSHRAGIQECRQLFLSDSPTAALELLRVLHTQADRFQREDVISLWIDQVQALKDARRPRPLGAYLALRKERFPDDTRSMSLAGTVLRLMGDSLGIPDQCRALPLSCFNALRRAGLYDEAVERYGAQVSPEAVVQGAYLQGRYEDVLAMEPEVPRLRARALVELGRAEEAIARYPEHSATAYLALGRYEELLERFSPSASDDGACMAALLALGRPAEIDALLDDPAGGWQWFSAQLRLRPAAILESSDPEAYRNVNDARVLIALNALRAGDRLKAEATLEEVPGIRAPDLWWRSHNGTELLLASLLRGLLGRPDERRADLKEIVANHQYKDKQALWHDAAYLTGRINATGFRAQPQRRRLERRLDFVRAVASKSEGTRRQRTLERY